MLTICLKITKPEPTYAYKRHAYIKKNMYQYVDAICIEYVFASFSRQI